VSAYRRGAYRSRQSGSLPRPAAALAGTVAVGLFLGYSAGKTVHHPGAGHHLQHKTQTVHPAQVTAVTGSGENAFWAAVLGDLAAPVTAANENSLTAWAVHEGPWGTVGRYNPLDSTLVMPGVWAFNTFDGDLHVWNYPSASEGAKATALTLEGGYPGITAALRTGNGLCGGGLGYEFGRWSGGGYREVC
jgi:hypothetical protein